MAKKSALKSFCETFAIKPKPPATDAQLAKAEKSLGGPLPKSLRAVYEILNGGVGENELSDLQLHSLKSALDYQDVPRFFDAPWALWPLLENNDSNPLCVACKGPLTGYVVLFSHEDGPTVMFRKLEDFFRTATAAVADGEYLDTHALPSDFAGPERTAADLKAAKHLAKLALGGELAGEEGIDAASFACDLFSDQQVDEIQSLLEIDDEYVQEKVKARLKRIPGAKAKKAVKKSADNFDAFVETCGALLKKEGFAATVLEMHGKKTIRLDPGPKWLNMEFFFSQRKREDFKAFLLEKVSAVAGKRKK